MQKVINDAHAYTAQYARLSVSDCLPVCLCACLSGSCPTVYRFVCLSIGLSV